MDTHRVRTGIMEPSGAGSRRRLCSKLTGAEPSLDLDEIKGRLAEIRRSSLDETTSLVQQFQLHAAGSPGFDVTSAETAADAVRLLEELAGDNRTAVVNRSAVVLNELAAGLKSSGFRIVEPYFDEAGNFEPQNGGCWDLPRLVRQGILPDFAVTYLDIPAVDFSSLEIKKCIAVLGVNAAAADGSILFLQHYSNISRALQQARCVVLVVTLDRLVATREQAEFQTRCSGLFGLESMLLNLKPKPSSGKEWNTLPNTGMKGQTLHVILLDNGRSQIAGSEFRNLLLCIGCRACLRQCPMGTSMVDDGTIWSPRNYLLQFLLGKLKSLDACLHCKACRIDCPLSIDLPALMWRAQSAKNGRTLQQVMLGNPERLARTGSITAPISNMVLGHGTGKLIKAGLGLDAQRDLPRFHRVTFRDWFAARRIGEAPRTCGRLTVYYAGCFTNYYQPEVGKATVRLLESNECKVVLTSEKCCGLAMIANKNIRDFHRNARHNIVTLAAAVEKGAVIVTTCPSCALMLKKEYPELIGGREAHLVSEHTQYIEDYLVNWRSGQKTGRKSAEEARSVFYHVPCHLKALDSYEEALSLWHNIPHLSVQKVSASCCGLGGYHGYKKAYSHQSREIGRWLFSDIQSSNTDLVISSCAACRLQIVQNTGIQACHPVQLLADSHMSWTDKSAEGALPRGLGGRHARPENRLY